jgi:hypothetical protein
MSVTLIVMMVLRVFAYFQTSNCTYQIYAVLYICYTILFFFLKNELVVYEIERSVFPRIH